MKTRNLALACAVVLASASTALAGTVAFEWVEGMTLGAVSRHNASGPVLADDFVPQVGGVVESIEWWGSAPLGSTGAPESFEVTFHAHDASGMNAIPDVPAATAPRGGLSQHFVNAIASDVDRDGIYHYQAAWTPQDMSLVAGTTYWFSVANATGSGWLWANPVLGGPSVGSERFGGVVSVGGPAAPVGPHFGPWNRSLDGQRLEQDFAFRINIVPEPSTWALFGLGLMGLTGIVRRRRKAAVGDEN